MKRILSLGAALQDIYLMDHDDLGSVEMNGTPILGKVVAGSKVDIDRLYFQVGGGGLNSAVSFARYGHETILMANIAEDAAGEAVLAALDAEGIDNSYMGFERRGGTGTSVILLDSLSGERTVLTYRGASRSFGNFSEEDLELARPDWLYITTVGGDMDTLERFIQKAHEMGAKVMLNPGEAEIRETKKLLGLLEDIDVLMVNKEEATGIVPGVLLTELAYRLSNYAPIVIVTDGGMGGIATNAMTGETYRYGIYEDVRTKDATGAGDAFGAGFLAAYADGQDFAEALKYASANSTSVIQQVGANAGALYGDDALHMMPMQRIEL